MEKRFQIIIGSPLNYEELVAYVVIDGKHIALLSQDEGKNKIKIEFFNEPKLEGIDYNIFIEALQEAKNELLR
jgi:hypothetical protein